MNTIHFFQRYRGNENRHSSAACLLLSFLYKHNNDLFYNLISNIFNVDKDDLVISFLTQTKNGSGHSIPDFTITQPGFRITVEAKEKDNTSNISQLEEHAKSLTSSISNYYFLILLVPVVGDNDKKNIELLKVKYPNIQCATLTYHDLYDMISDLLVEIRDDDMIEILEDFYDYCEEEKLLNKAKDTMMIRLSGDTLGWNIENKLYFDVATHKSTGFYYLGLYKDKAVKYIGKIRTIVNCKYTKDKAEVASILFGKLEPSDIKTIQSSLEMQSKKGNNMAIEYAYFLVEDFVKTSYIKDSKYALYGRKKVYLPDLGINTNDTSEIATELSKQRW